jgi:hypothetical protein
MARPWKIAIALLAVLAIVGLVTLPTLMRSVLRLRHAGVSEEEAHRELTQPTISTPTDTPKTAKLFWISANSQAVLDSSEVELPLSADPVQRSKQLIIALITRPPSATQRTLPADTELLQFYLLPDGTAIADFSEALSNEMPSGILSEQMAVDSLLHTLGENVSGIHQLKILIRGQEADTLAGHVDLTGYFRVEPDPLVSSSTSDNSVPAPVVTAVPAKAPTVSAPAVAGPAAVLPAAHAPSSPVVASPTKTP